MVMLGNFMCYKTNNMHSTREYDATIIEQLYQIVAMLQWIKQYVDNFHQ